MDGASIATDSRNASMTMLMGIKWWDKMIAEFEIKKECFPAIKKSLFYDFEIVPAIAIIKNIPI
jgi:glycerol kinase